MSTKDIGINTKTVRIPLPRIEGVELKNATVDLERGIVVAEYGQEDLYRTVKTGDFLTCLSDPSKTVIFNSIAPPIGKMKVFTILYDLPILINGKVARTLLGAKFPFSNFRYSTEEEKSLMIEEMEKLGKRYNPKTFRIEDMTKEESVEKLEVGKDYVQIRDCDIVIIDKSGDFDERVFINVVYHITRTCVNPENWREATKEEVIKAFKKHLNYRFGEDWRTMKIKERHPNSTIPINDGSWEVEIVKSSVGWNVWNENGLLYCDGIWVERLEEPENKKIMKTAGQVMDEINQMNDGGIVEIYKVQGGFKTKLQSGWTPAPEDIEEMNKKEIKMKKYRLKQWYPSLLKDVRVGDIITENGQHYKGVTHKCISYRVEIWQLHPDFWELIEEEKPKPLFITEDGVEISDLCQTVYLIHPKTFIRQKSDLGYFSTNDLDNNKLFYHESNADEYVWKNKRVFSYNDIEKYQSGGEGTWWNVEAIAKGRSKE